jgi:hypothetical protein
VSSLAESPSGAHLSFGSLFLPIFRGYGGLERAKQLARNPGDVVDSRVERGFVRLGWFVEAADFPDELQRCSENLFLCDWWLKVEECLNISAHFALPPTIFWVLITFAWTNLIV